MNDAAPSLAVPAFVTGAIVRDSEIERSIAAFGRPVLVKPFELAELERMINTWLPQ